MLGILNAMLKTCFVVFVEQLILVGAPGSEGEYMTLPGVMEPMGKMVENGWKKVPCRGRCGEQTHKWAPKSSESAPAAKAPRGANWEGLLSPYKGRK